MKRLVIPGFLISLCIRLIYPLLLNFDGLYGQDPYAYFDYSRQITRLFTAGVPLGRFYYPLGFPLLGALGAPLLTVAICGAISCVLCGMIAWEIAEHLKFPTLARTMTVIIAWMILTAMPQHIQSSAVIMSDVPALMWVLLSIWAMLRYERNQRIAWIMLAAFAGALAAMTRFQYALIVLPIGLYILFIWRDIQLKHAVAAILIGLLTYAPQIVMTLQNPEIISENRIVWTPQNIRAQMFTTGDGTHIYDEPNYLFYLLPVRSPFYISLWLLPLVIIGLIVVIRYKIGLFLLLWFISQYVFLAGIPVQNIRYALIAFPPILFLIAVSVGWLIQKKYLKLVLPVFLVFGLAEMAYTTNGLMNNFIDNKNRDMATLRWIESHIPERNATVYALDMIPAMQHYLPYQTVQIYYETPDTINAKRDSRPAYAFFNQYAMLTQWVGRPTGQVYQTIMGWSGWQSLGEINGYTLFRLN